MSKIKFEVRNNGPDESHNTRVRLTGLDNTIVETITPSIGYIMNGHDWYIGLMGDQEEATLEIECSLIEDITTADITGVVSGSNPDLSPWNNTITVTIEAPQEPEPAGCPFTSDYSTGSMNFGIQNGKTVADMGGMVVDVIFAEGTAYPAQLGIEEVGSLTTDRPEKLGVGGVIMLMEDSGTYILQCVISMSEDMSGYESVLTIGELVIPFQFASTNLQAVAFITTEQRDALISMDELCISVDEPVEIQVPEADLSVNVQPVAGEEDRYLVTVANIGTPLDGVRVSMYLNGTYTGNGTAQRYFDIDPDIEISHGELDSSTIPNWLVGRMEDGDTHTMEIGIKSLSVVEDITMEFRTSSGYTYPAIPDPEPDNNSFSYTFTKEEMPDPVTFHLNDGVADDTLLEFDIMGRTYNIPVVTAYNDDGSREVEAQQVYYSSNNIFRAPLAAGDTRVDVTMLTEYGTPHTGVFKFPSYTPRAVDARRHIIGVDWGVNTRYSGYVFDRLEELVSVPDFLPSTVTTAAEMFIDCFKINDPNIAAWDVSNVTDMTRMFRASLQGTSVVFNQDLSGWCVSNIPSEPADFAATRSTSWDTSKQPVWGTCPQG